MKKPLAYIFLWMETSSLDCRSRAQGLIRSGRTIDAIRLDGWRIAVGYPDDRDEAERRLQAVTN